MISIHAPREGSDNPTNGHDTGLIQFLSTLPARGATRRSRSRPGNRRHFYPRSPRGERRRDRPVCADLWHFYPRSPRGERRPLSGIFSPHRGYFYPRSPRGERHPGRRTMRSRWSFLSTLPARGATLAYPQLLGGVPISIHAPREGSDGNSGTIEGHSSQFLSTLPARGATVPIV